MVGSGRSSKLFPEPPAVLMVVGSAGDIQTAPSSNATERHGAPFRVRPAATLLTYPCTRVPILPGRECVGFVMVDADRVLLAEWISAELRCMSRKRAGRIVRAMEEGLSERAEQARVFAIRAGPRPGRAEAVEAARAAFERVAAGYLARTG